MVVWLIEAFPSNIQLTLYGEKHDISEILCYFGVGAGFATPMGRLKIGCDVRVVGLKSLR